MKSYGKHIDPEKDEQLKLARIEVENKVKKIMKLAKGINGNTDVNLKKKSDIIQLIGDFHQQYESLYSLYEDLRGEVKKNVNGEDNVPSSSSDSESYYSPVASTPKSSSETSMQISKEDSETSDVEDTILKDKLTSSSEVNKNSEKRNLAELEGEVARLKVEVECKENEAMQVRDEKTRLEARVMELEATCKASNVELEEKLSCEMKGLIEKVETLQNELELEKKSAEPLEGDSLSNIKNKHEEHLSELQQKILDSEKELSAERRKFKACRNEFLTQMESLNGKVKNLEQKLQNERSVLQTEVEALRSEKKEHLTKFEKERQEFLASKSKWEKKNSELSEKIGNQQKTLLELGDSVSKLRAENEKAAQMKFIDAKPNFHLVEKKVDELAEEFRKQFEDKYRILSRRIRVAEQLHVENKEWYQRTKEQESKELSESIRQIKDISATANDMLLSLDSMALKFEECNANFLNRISKSSCELKFVREWSRRKNKALVQVKQDLEGLHGQLDDKEGEILVLREKIWKSEHKTRELEKTIKEKEDAMMGLREEKREAIRQLCVWIDYHRSRSDYYMKLLLDMNQGRRKASSNVGE